MTVFYIMRHGETLWNAQGRMQGQLNSELSPQGNLQRNRICDFLSRTNPDQIISSDLQRCLQTVSPLANQLGLEIQPESRLRERHLGALQGLTRAEAGRQQRGDGCDFDFADPDYLPPGGETLRQVFARSTTVLEELAARFAQQKVIVVTHGGVIKCLFHRAIGLPIEMPRRFSIENADIHCLEIEEDRWHLRWWGVEAEPASLLMK
ncbi:MAG: histidine phosphatase family protein [Puniceicoccaceae bacterium]